MRIFDFDGTIVDVWQRYHAVFSQCIFEEEPPLEDYKRAKLSLMEDSLVAQGLSVTLKPNFRSIKQELLESERYLAMDNLVIPADILLGHFASADSIILTKRRNEPQFRQQLYNLGLGAINDSAYVVAVDEEMTKADWIAKKISSKSIEAVIGDSEEDIAAANKLATKAIFVESGLRLMSQITKVAKIDHTYPTIKSYLDTLK